MAVVQNSLIGRTRGSIGGVTFSTQFGLNVAKAKPVSVANPQTDKQMMRRSALSQVTAIGRVLLGVISITFRSLAVGKSAYNAFSSLALREAFDFTTPPTAEFTPATLMISKGTIAPTEILSASYSAVDHEVSVSFNALNSGVGQHNSDLAVLVAYCAGSQKILGAITTDVRADGGSTLDVSLIDTESPVTDVYLAFVDANFSLSSDSVWSSIGQA